MTGPEFTPGSRGERGVPELLLLIAAAVAIAALGFAVAQRIGVPFALEWQEPAMLEHALRVSAGLPLYVEPGLEFAPFPYPPVFHWVGALFCELVGPLLPALRLVSLLGVLMIVGALIGSFRWIVGLAAAGWFAALWGWTGFWLDVARVDSLALGFGSLGFALVLKVERRVQVSQGRAAEWYAAFGGIASALAVLTKQTQLGLAVALFIALLLGARTRSAAAVYLLTFLGGLVPIVLWLESASSGWFLWTTVDLLRGSPWHGPAILGFWAESMIPLGIPIALAIVPMGARGAQASMAPAVSPVLLLGCAALAVTGWAGRAHEGGFDNTLLPVALASAFGCGAALRSLMNGSTGRWAGSSIMVGATLLMVPLPWHVIPNDDDRRAYDEAVERVGAMAKGGEIWQPVSAVPSGRPGFVHRMAIVDLAKSQETEAAARLFGDLRVALEGQRFSAIVLGSLPRDGWADLARLIDTHYEVSEDLEGPGNGDGDRSPLTPVTGAPLKPRYVLTPRRP